jgi:bacteriorhodopsin
MITYILLLTTATITFIEAIRTNVPGVRHVLNLETCISIIAGYFYSVFLALIEGYTKENKPINWAEISKTRYVDWSITTPLMLLTLCIVLGMHTKQVVHLATIIIVCLLNYVMLFAGYLGEIGSMDRSLACIIGYFAFFGMFGIIYVKFVKPKYVWENYMLFGFYLLVWSLYGIFYLLDECVKNIAMNILDCIAKCLIGLGLWAYYTKVIV